MFALRLYQQNRRCTVRYFYFIPYWLSRKSITVHFFTEERQIKTLRLQIQMKAFCHALHQMSYSWTYSVESLFHIFCWKSASTWAPGRRLWHRVSDFLYQSMKICILAYHIPRMVQCCFMHNFQTTSSVNMPGKVNSWPAFRRTQQNACLILGSVHHTLSKWTWYVWHCTLMHHQIPFHFLSERYVGGPRAEKFHKYRAPLKLRLLGRCSTCWQAQ